jgi:hypothetical protein
MNEKMGLFIIDEPLVFHTLRNETRISSVQPEAVRLRARDTRKFVEVRLRDLRKLLNGEPRIARAAIGKHVQKITMTPEGRTYIASGSWDSLGLGAVAVSMVPGAWYARICHKPSSL